MEKTIIIGLMGTIGSGKTTVSDYLVKKGFERVIMGNLIRAKAVEEGLELTRENLTFIQEKYRNDYGKDYFINYAIKKLKDSGKKLLLIDGIRLPVDAEIAKRERAFLILVDAPPEVRFERLKERKRENDPQTLEDFRMQEELELKTFFLDSTLKHVDYTIDNSGTPEETYKKVDELIEEIS